MLPPPHLLAALALALSPALVAAAGGFGEPPAQPSAPPKVAPTKLDNFTWADPFGSPRIAQFAAACAGAATFAAGEYQLHDLSAPERQGGLQPYSEALKGVFVGRPYPGGWGGVDAHGYERTLLKMEYADVPARVRRWIEAQARAGAAGSGLFAVFDKPPPAAAAAAGEGEGEEEGARTVASIVDLSGDDEDEDARALDEERAVVFAPGAIYETLPLWVAEGSGCEEELANLDNYSPSLVDGGVVGWPTEHTKPSRGKGSRDIKFTIKAWVLSGQVSASAQKEAQDPVASHSSKDEL